MLGRGDYLALQAFTTPTPAGERHLDAIRVAVAELLAWLHAMETGEAESTGAIAL